MEDSKKVNLYGSENAGKTYIGWFLANSSEFKYASSLESADFESEKMIIDHGNVRRKKTRELRNLLKLNNVKRLIYITRKPAKEVHPKVKLEITSDDQKHILANWEDLGFPLNDMEDGLREMRRG